MPKFQGRKSVKQHFLSDNDWPDSPMPRYATKIPAIKGCESDLHTSRPVRIDVTGDGLIDAWSTAGSEKGYRAMEHQSPDGEMSWLSMDEK